MQLLAPQRYLPNRECVFHTFDLMSLCNCILKMMRTLANTCTRLDQEYSQKIMLVADETVELDQMVEFPSEFLNSLNPSGLPPHLLRLKPYTEIMLLRNLNPSIGLMNDTRIQVKRLLDNVLIATILGGKFEGQDMIPKILMAPLDCVYQFRRFQFPVRLSYCMTFNMSQGQTL